jgi:hypothetical protein
MNLIYHPPVHAARRLLILIALVGPVPSGCGADPVGGKPARPRFSFDYRASDGDGNMNQVLKITNPGPRAWALVLKLTAIDASGNALPDVTVSTVYGSDRGGLVVPARFGAIDVMRFIGKHRDRVADVRATVVTATLVQYPAVTADPVVTPLDASGAVVTRNDVFARLQVADDNDDPITIRLVYIIWNMPPDGQTQQADLTTPVGGLVTVPAHGQATLRLTPAEQAVVRQHSGTAPTSIKAYFSS